jgi:hypothetical protein
MYEFYVFINLLGYIYIYIYVYASLLFVGRDIAVGIATRYGLDGPGIETRCHLLVLLGDLTFMGPCIVSIF